MADGHSVFAFAASVMHMYLYAMDNEQFRKHAHELVDWIADFYNDIRDYPVMAQVQPGEIKDQLPANPPLHGEPFEALMRDFKEIVVPGMTHWQAPGFHAYFPGNSSPPSVLAEMLTATLGAQCMMWQTSPSAAELEEVMMGWLAQMIGLPGKWDGVIQDTASSATLCALLTARESESGYGINRRGFSGGERFTVYGSTETHSSIEKAVSIAGFGTDQLRKVKVTVDFAMDPNELSLAIQRDLNDGFTPLAVVATIGTTGSTAIDPLDPIARICREFDLWLHVDAAYAGSALILEEMRWMIAGIDQANSFVFNPHKWLFTNFDCSAYFVRDKEALIRTFEIHPEYLKTREPSPVNNYRDWGIQLGRRFRALKLWFVIRTYGVDGLKALIKKHLELARQFVRLIEGAEDFELLAPMPLNLVCFRYNPTGVNDPDELNRLNEDILGRVNRTGKIFITHTKLSGKYTLRFVCANLRVEQADIDNAWQTISEAARNQD